MELKFNDSDYIIRAEFFGGLLINKRTMEKYQLSHLDAIYLLLIKAGISHDRAIDKLTQYRNVLFEPDLSFYLNNRAIVEDESNSISSSLNAETKAKVIFDNMDYIQRQNFLSAPIELTIYPSLNCQFDCEFCFDFRR